MQIQYTADTIRGLIIDEDRMRYLIRKVLLDDSWCICGMLLIYCFVLYHPLTLSPSHPLTLSPSHPLTLSPSHPLTLSPSHPLTLSPSHPLTLSPSHPLTLSPSHPLPYLSFAPKLCWLIEELLQCPAIAAESNQKLGCELFMCY